MSEERRDRAYLTEEELESSAALNDTEFDEGDSKASEPTFEMLNEIELRSGETADSTVATEEGLAWVPPIDPPVVADRSDSEGVRIAAGFGVDALDEPYDADHHGELVSLTDEFEDRIREALLADSATSRYADSLVIGNRGSTVVVRGVVDDIDDTDNVADVIGNVDGVDEVIYEMEVTGVTD